MALERLGRPQQLTVGPVVGDEFGGDPAIDVPAAEAEAGFAQDPGTAQRLATGLELAAGEAEQLGDGGGPSLPPLQLHQGQIEGAAPKVHHQHAATGGKPGADCGGGGFVHQGQLGHRERTAHLPQPLAIAAVGLDRGGEHQPVRLHSGGQGPPDPLQQQGSGGLGRQPGLLGGCLRAPRAFRSFRIPRLRSARPGGSPGGAARRRGLGGCPDASLEIPQQARSLAIGQPCVEHLPTHQSPRRALRAGEPDQAGHHGGIIEGIGG